ncbi:DUF6086 family protein [Nocardia halotolerans]|uniref:DUF6086 family protein n=1 Tax=Nocardia halotolerans TaxID=1755878 RepID=A0ABV8VMX4_9NOCA
MMSYAFEVGDQTVWSPALRVGDLFVRIHSDVCSVVDVATGLTAVANDMYEIDIEVFKESTQAIFDEYFRSNHPEFRAMVGPTLSLGVNILNYCQQPLTPRSQEQSDFISWANSLSMPR